MCAVFVTCFFSSRFGFVIPPDLPFHSCLPFHVSLPRGVRADLPGMRDSLPCLPPERGNRKRRRRGL